MSIFKNIFKSNSDNVNNVESKINWIQLTDLNQLEEIKEISNSETVAIFKHSTRCGISRMVIKMFEKQFDENLSTFKVFYLDLLNHREISNEIGYTFQVLHQSPQILVIKNKKAIAHASHYDITTLDLKKYLE